jgi:uncharacterized membrane protein
MLKIIVTYLAMLFSFFVLDLIWLGLIAKPLYQQKIGFLLADNVNWLAAILFYLIFLVGILVFVILPNQQNTLLKIIVMGALFGFVTYCTYDLINLATVKNWPWLITVIDLCWGSVLCALVSAAGYVVLRLF